MKPFVEELTPAEIAEIDRARVQPGQSDDQAENIGQAETPIQKGFDVDAAMNTDGFLEFMAKHPEAGSLDMEDTAALEQRFEAFKVKDEVTTGMKGVIAEQVKKESGIAITDEAMAEVVTKMETLAVTEPGKFLEMKTKLEGFKTLPTEIAGIEGKLATLGNSTELEGDLEKLQTKQEKLSSIADHAGRWGRMKLWTAMIKNKLPEFGTIFESPASIKQSLAERAPDSIEAAEKIKTIAELEAEKGGVTLFKSDMDKVSKETDASIASIEQTLGQISDLSTVKAEAEKHFGAVRSELLGGIGDFKTITGMLQAEVKRALEETVAKGDMAALENALAAYEHYKNLPKETGVDYLGTVDKDKLEKDLDKAIQDEAFEEMLDAVMNSKLGANALGNLEKTLEGWIKREKIGTKKGDEARQFIRKALEDIRDGLNNGQGDFARKHMVSRILIKLTK